MNNVQLGLKENWKQFSMLVVMNAFVGGMIGLERSILPLMAEAEFGLVTNTAILSFIVVFGIVKAVTNYYTGRLSNFFGRRKLLIVGWLFAVPVPFILMFANDWNWIIAANVLLGINQGLAWSSTVVMKIDLAGEKQRGMAIGMNEFAGYSAVALSAFLTGWIAGEYGLRPYPFYLGFVLVALGLLGSVFFIRDTRHHLNMESAVNRAGKLKKPFWETTWKHKTLGSVTVAGLINNLNDGMAWGLFPILLAARGFSLEAIGLVTGTYPLVWGIGQLFTGKMADRFPKKNLLYLGMLIQAMSLISMVWAHSLTHFLVLAALLGWGTAMVYPTFMAAIADNTHPRDRAGSIGIFRLWRDMGYAIGAVLTGVIVDWISMEASLVFIGGLTLFSSLILFFRMK